MRTDQVSFAGVGIDPACQDSRFGDRLRAIVGVSLSCPIDIHACHRQIAMAVMTITSNSSKSITHSLTLTSRDLFTMTWLTPAKGGRRSPCMASGQAPCMASGQAKQRGSESAPNPVSRRNHCCSLLLPKFGEAIEEQHLPLATLAGRSKTTAQTGRADLRPALLTHGIGDRFAPLRRCRLRNSD